MGLDVFDFFARVLVIFTTMPVHEFAHGWVAHRLGDDTASSQGRLDLNPFRHIDPIGAVLLLVTGFGWAKPVPVNPHKFTKKMSMRGAMALTALAGPVANILLALVLMLPVQFLLGSGMIMQQTASIIASILVLMVQLNVGLAVFNLLPIPPLDGYNVASYFIPPKIAYKIASHRQLIAIILLAILILPPLQGLLYAPMNFFSGLVYKFLEFSTSFMSLIGNMFR